MAKTYSVEAAANAIMDMSSPSEFDESSDSIEYDSNWDEASTTSKVGENEETDISLSAVKLTRKELYMESEEGTEFRVGLEVVEQHSQFHKTNTITNVN